VFLPCRPGLPKAPRPPVTAPLRALQVLEALAGMVQPASLAAVAETTRLPTTKAYRSLRALQGHGFVDHLGHSGYRLGSRSVALASLIGPRPALLRAAQPLLSRLAAVAQETTSLHLRSGTHRVLVIGAEARGQALRGSYTVGERTPLTSGCSGTSSSPTCPPPKHRTSPPATRREYQPSTALLAVIRTNGYGMSLSDNHVGVNGVAAPLLDPADGYPLGSIAIADAERRLPEAKLRELVRPLITPSRELPATWASPLAS